VSAEPEAKPVVIGIDYGAPRYYETKTVSWKEGMTVLDALQAAVPLETSLHGENIIVTSIDGQAMVKDQMGWMYDVNGKLGNNYAGKYVLSPGDYIRWMYASPKL
jgi:hypothetical protein